MTRLQQTGRCSTRAQLRHAAPVVFPVGFDGGGLAIPPESLQEVVTHVTELRKPPYCMMISGYVLF
jgi:hypothetical protein